MEVCLDSMVFWVEQEDFWAQEGCWVVEPPRRCHATPGGFALVSTLRLKVLNLENARVSWKVLRGSELVLNLYSKLVLRFPGIFQFLSGSSVEANITSHIALTQDSPGDLKLVLKDCKNLLGGFSVSLRKGLLTNLVSSLLNKSLKSFVPALLCPLVNAWVSIININLQFLNRVISFGLLGKIYSALSKLPVTSGHYVELDLQNSPFPSTFIDWLLQISDQHLNISMSLICV
ncbi:hypothetical protein DUI87_27831 [Hirundo rustica rustica]|uniref:Lipid-binding serum glycoprotein N-terminal domain-containing protein n=2 Tax=Hirundo rustica TaxID=43150 RepID=A0A3M0J472_HIRRU|nr:hypothetical protein DUI87_27831 [Hirundo rustica rustica]